MKLYCVKVFNAKAPHAFRNMALCESESLAFDTFDDAKSMGHKVEIEEIDIHGTSRELAAMVHCASTEDRMN